MTENPESTEGLELKLGVRFSDRALLARCVTHRSYANETGEPSNETLEFLGDALLGFLVAEMALTQEWHRDEGVMTKVKSRVVCEESLAEVARDLGLGKYLRLSRGEDKTGGRDKPSILSDTLEAVLAAVYMDQGFQATRAVVQSLLADRVAAGLREDPKSLLQERSHGRGLPPPKYRMLESSGPDHKPMFVIECTVGDAIATRGQGPTKKDAERVAAREALEILGTDPT